MCVSRSLSLPCAEALTQLIPADVGVGVDAIDRRLAEEAGAVDVARVDKVERYR